MRRSARGKAVDDHAGEAVFSVGWPDVVVFLAVVGIFLYLARIGRTPEPKVMRETVAILNTKGGNILLLAVFSIYFFSKAMQFFYHAIALVSEKKISPENAVLMMGVAFVTGTAFGGAFSSLVSVLSGENRHMERQADRGARPPEPPTPEKVNNGG